MRALWKGALTGRHSLPSVLRDIVLCGDPSGTCRSNPKRAKKRRSESSRCRRGFSTMQRFFPSWFHIFYKSKADSQPKTYQPSIANFAIENLVQHRRIELSEVHFENEKLKLKSARLMKRI